MRPSIPVIVLMAVVLWAPGASAQDNRRAGLFTEARQLPLISQTVELSARGGAAELHLVQVFFNDGPDVGQADYQLYLPEQTAVTSFAFWRKDTLIEAVLKEKSEAERSHDAAAATGRATGILKTDDGVQRFSVFPVKAGEYQRIELSLRVPVVREMGRSQVALAMDRFLARGPAAATVVAEIHTDEPLSGAGVSGVRASTVSRGDRRIQLAFSTEQPVEVWWTERGRPLSIAAHAVPLDGGGRAVAVRILLNDAGAWRATYKALHIFVDGSFSMRRRRDALVQVLDRLMDQSPVPVQVWAVGERTRRLASSTAPNQLADLALNGEAGFTAKGEHFERAMRDAGCDGAAVRCVGLTDLQLFDLERLSANDAFVFLGDAHERAFTQASLAEPTSIFLTDVEAPGKLRSLADEKVLPVLEVVGVTQLGTTLHPVRASSTRVAEGGLLQLFFQTESESPLSLALRVGGKELPPWQVVPSVSERESPEGRSVRFGFWERKLADWMAAYRKAPDADLKKMIVDASVREGIPTAFTALQAVAPELSLAAIKPGDPLLTVEPEQGLVDVVAWYPFGEARRLARDEVTGRFHDRFLVPRGWNDRSYAVDVFKVYSDGTVREERAWYVLDNEGPRLVLMAGASGELELKQTDGTDLAAVHIELPGGRTWSLSPVNGRWLLRRDKLPDRFDVIARDRAGNTTQLRVGIRATDHGRTQRPAASSRPRAPLSSTGGDRLSVEGTTMSFTMGDRRYRFDLADVPLASGRVTASLAAAGTFVIGSDRGDLVRLRCSGVECSARRLTSAFHEHPITGLARLDDRRVLVGVLGKGLYELSGDTLVKSSLRVGSTFITGVLDAGADVLIGTAYNGLWRVVGGRVLRERFPSKRVTSLERLEARVEVTSGPRRYVRIGRDRSIFAGAAIYPEGSAAIMSSAVLGGTLYLGGFDSGLWRWASGMERMELALRPLEKQVNALTTFGGSLWAATEGGVLRLTPQAGTLRVERITTEPAQDVSSSVHGLAVASASGVLLVDAVGTVRRINPQLGVDVRRVFAVRWLDGVLYAGGMDGLYRIDGSRSSRIGFEQGFDGGWVTALTLHDGSVWVGTYAHGVYRLANDRVELVPETAGQWVPLRAMSVAGGALWVGGLGMDALRMSPDGRWEAVHLPVRDTNGFVTRGSDVLALTSQGVFTVRARESSHAVMRSAVSRTPRGEE